MNRFYHWRIFAIRFLIIFIALIGFLFLQKKTFAATTADLTDGGNTKLGTCSIDKATASPTDTVTFTISTNNYAEFTDGSIVQVSQGTHVVNNIGIKETSYIQGAHQPVVIKLNNVTPGTYSVGFASSANSSTTNSANPDPYGNDIQPAYFACEITSGLTVTPDPNAPTTKTLTVDPATVSVISRTIDKITISGLDTNNSLQYHLKLGDGWTNDKHNGYMYDTQNKTGNFSSKNGLSNGSLTLTNICENGETNRSGSNACGTPFNNTTYSIDVFTTGVNGDIPVSSVHFVVNEGAQVAVSVVPNPIDTNVKTITSLTFTGLPPNRGIEFDLSSPWNGNQIGHGNNTHDKNRWTSDANGTIEVDNICQNGNADRDGSNTGDNAACTTSFSPGNYSISIKDLDANRTIATLQAFSVTKVAPYHLNPPCTADNCTTALGNLSPTPSGFVNTILELGIGIGGVIALILIIFGGFRIATSGGDAEAIKNNQALITSAIAGLVFILASVFLLNFVGGNVLGIPGFQGQVTNVTLPKEPVSNTYQVYIDLHKQCIAEAQNASDKDPVIAQCLLDAAKGAPSLYPAITSCYTQYQDQQHTTDITKHAGTFINCISGAVQGF